MVRAITGRHQVTPTQTDFHSDGQPPEGLPARCDVVMLRLRAVRRHTGARRLIWLLGRDTIGTEAVVGVLGDRSSVKGFPVTSGP
jgi:hypothetical protein